MKILFLCTAHNSLSQRIYLALSRRHSVSIEYGLSDERMIEAVALFQPDIVLCPFPTALVPKQIYDKVLTLIVHPGPPGDAGPSALDWVLIGDDGSIEDPDELFSILNTGDGGGTRSHWGVTVLQAIEKFDAGPIWAFEQFAIDIDTPGLTKSTLYRNQVTRAAINAVCHAILRLEDLATQHAKPQHTHGPELRPLGMQIYSPSLKALPAFGKFCASQVQVFQGGPTYTRPLLKASSRDFDVSRHTAQQMSRRIRSGDSQPGVLCVLPVPSLFTTSCVYAQSASAIMHSCSVQSTRCVSFSLFVLESTLPTSTSIVAHHATATLCLFIDFWCCLVLGKRTGHTTSGFDIHLDGVSLHVVIRSSPVLGR